MKCFLSLLLAIALTLSLAAGSAESNGSFGIDNVDLNKLPSSLNDLTTLITVSGDGLTTVYTDFSDGSAGKEATLEDVNSDVLISTLEDVVLKLGGEDITSILPKNEDGSDIQVESDPSNPLLGVWMAESMTVSGQSMDLAEMGLSYLLVVGASQVTYQVQSSEETVVERYVPAFADGALTATDEKGTALTFQLQEDGTLTLETTFTAGLPATLVFSKIL